MNIFLFDRRFFTLEDVNFDGYEDFYFTDYMGMVNSSKIVYLYNPSNEKFEINEDYRSITSLSLILIIKLSNLLIAEVHLIMKVKIIFFK